MLAFCVPFELLSDHQREKEKQYFFVNLNKRKNTGDRKVKKSF